MEIPETHQTIMPYLIVVNAAQFIDFMKNVFGATETNRHMRDENIIMHAELMIGNSTIMLADCTDQWQPRTAGMFIYVDNADEKYKKAMDQGSV